MAGAPATTEVLNDRAVELVARAVNDLKRIPRAAVGSVDAGHGYQPEESGRIACAFASSRRTSWSLRPFPPAHRALTLDSSSLYKKEIAENRLIPLVSGLGPTVYGPLLGRGGPAVHRADARVLRMSPSYHGHHLLAGLGFLAFSPPGLIETVMGPGFRWLIHAMVMGSSTRSTRVQFPPFVVRRRWEVSRNDRRPNVGLVLLKAALPADTPP